jgi:hypothetical protein
MIAIQRTQVMWWSPGRTMAATTATVMATMMRRGSGED